MRFLVLVGSIMSGLGKGIASASIAKLLKMRGLKVGMVKFDGYLNVDCGTMNPFRHGEVFVLQDGSEVDMDFGTYERFLNEDIKGSASITGGKIFKKIIEKERKGGYLGEDVQFVPHLTREIKNWVKKEAEGKDVVIIEVGGTVGDLENGYFLEAMRQLKAEEEVVVAQLTYVPITANGEEKTKPTQHATRLLQSIGLQPDIIICRAERNLKKETKRKIALYCNVREEDVFNDPKLESVYHLPLIFEKEGVCKRILAKLGLKYRAANIKQWANLTKRINKGERVEIAIVGKYISVKDAYASVKEAIMHATAYTRAKAVLKWIEAERIEKEGVRALRGCKGILVPGGFGKRGIEGKIKAVEFARKNKIPFLGLCLGMQLMAVEFARNVCGMEASSSEFDKAKIPIVDLLPEQRGLSQLGGTMRKGAIKIILKENTLAFNAYKSKEIYERHRHRYALNREYLPELEKKGLVVSGMSSDGVAEIIEWKTSFGIATQAHAEFTSRFERPAPLFVAFLKAALEFKLKGKEAKNN